MHVEPDELSSTIFMNDEAIKANDGLLMALAKGEPIDKFLGVLRKHAESAYYEMSGQAEHDQDVAAWELREYQADISHAAMM